MSSACSRARGRPPRHPVRWTLWTWALTWLLASPPSLPGQHIPSDATALDGAWELLLDPADDGRQRELFAGDDESWREALAVTVPGAWELLPEAVGYDGIAWYRTRLPEPPMSRWTHRLFLEFDGANARADAWLDGEHLGRHTGADAPFRFDVTDRAAAGGVLVVRVVDPGHEPVDGLRLGALPHAKESWYLNYGGLTGPVRLRSAWSVELHAHDVWLTDDGALRGALVLENHLDETVSVTVDGWIGRGYDEPVDDGEPVTLTKRDVTLAPGRQRVELRLASPMVAAALAPWSPESPSRHTWSVRWGHRNSSRLVELPFGVRRFEVRGDQFILNGEPRRLRGVLFQPYDPGTLCTPPTADWRRDELLAIKAAGFDLVRAHIRVMPELYALCDEIGLLVQAEPTLGWITTVDEHTRPAVDEALRVVADAVAGHPSVVMVGLLNEMSGELWPRTAELHARAHELLPQHLVLDDSGSWQGSAHYWNPGAAAPVPYDDLHVYRAWPWTDADLEFAANLGLDEQGEPTGRLVYVSEFGYGGIPSLRANVAGFGERRDLADAREHVADLVAAQALVRSGVLGPLAPDVDALSLLGQRNQARALTVMTSALRRNPRLAGDCVTQWRDASWECGAGLVDVWAHPKPALAAMAALNAAAPDAPRDPTSDRPALPARDTAPLAAGQLLAVTQAQADVLAPLVVAPDAAAAALPRLAVLGRRPSPWSADNVGVTAAVLRWVRDGGTALLLDAPDAGKPLDAFFFGYDGLGQVADLPVDLTAAAARGHFVGTHLGVHPDSPLLADIPRAGPVLDERFGLVRPHVVLRPGPDVDARVELACLDGYGALQGGAVMSVRYGAGRLLLSTLRLDEEQLGDPLARRLLENVVRWASGESAAHAAERGPPPAVVDASPPPALADELGRLVWRHKIAFGLAERLTVQSSNGVRPRRDPPAELARLVAAKNRGLDLVLQGRAEHALPVLKGVEQGPLSGPRDAFLRKELELSGAFYRPTHTERPAARSLGQTLDVGRHHARGLRLMRLGRTDEALAELEAAVALVHELDAGTGAADAEPDEG